MGKTNEEIKQMQLNELTMFQQIAAEAEVLMLMQECESADEYEKIYYAFLKLALCDEKYLLVYKHEFMKHLDHEVVNDLVSYRYKNIIPTYLYVKKYIREINTLQYGSDSGNVRIYKHPTPIIQSKFIVAMREIIIAAPKTALAILDGMLRENEDISFLYPVIMVLKQEAQEKPDVAEVIEYSSKIKLLSIPITRVPLMDLKIEDEHIINSTKGVVSPTEEKNAKSLSLNITSLINPIPNEYEDEFTEEYDYKMVYMVKKIDKSSNRVVFTKEFDTQKQATEYIKNVVKDYPEIAKQFHFAVELCEVDY